MMSHEAVNLAVHHTAGQEMGRTSGAGVPLPPPSVPISVRVATMDDLPFLDSLQKQYGKALGYFPTQQFEGYIAMGGILMAESGEGQRDKGTEGQRENAAEVSA